LQKKIFISCSSKDAKAAHTICGAIEARGYPCWISSRDVGPGENFQGEIVRAIRDAGLMVLVFSANANASAEITKEIALASQHRLVVIPVRIEDVMPSEELSYEFATRQWIDVFDDWERAIQQLLAQIAKILPPQSVTAQASAEIAAANSQAVRAEPVSAEHAPVAPAPLAPQLRMPWAAALAAAALIAVAGGLYAVWPSPRPADDGMPAGNAEMLQGAAAFDKKDYAQAMQLFRKAADMGNSGGMYDIGWFYENGLGVPRDYTQAAAWYRRAADLGNPPAEYCLGVLYANGLGVAEDKTAATVLLRRAADMGYTDANAAIAKLNAGQRL
jgi:tetratricopeptide (TPR) repeat protein